MLLNVCDGPGPLVSDHAKLLLAAALVVGTRDARTIVTCRVAIVRGAPWIAMASVGAPALRTVSFERRRRRVGTIRERHGRAEREH
jgi:hypothetical protein